MTWKLTSEELPKDDSLVIMGQYHSGFFRVTGDAIYTGKKSGLGEWVTGWAGHAVGMSKPPEYWMYFPEDSPESDNTRDFMNSIVVDQCISSFTNYTYCLKDLLKEIKDKDSIKIIQEKINYWENRIKSDKTFLEKICK